MWLPPVWFIIGSLALSERVQARGTESGWNTTSTVSSRDTNVTVILSSSGNTAALTVTSTSAFDISTLSTTINASPTVAHTNGGCGGCTINVRDATVQWWFPATYRHPVHGFGNETTRVPFTPFPATKTLDISGIITNSQAWITTKVYLPYASVTIDERSAYTITPSAAQTTAVLRTAYVPLTVDSIDPMDFEKYSTPAPPASVIISGPAGSLSPITSTTSFVVFTAYELEQVHAAESGGTTVCSTKTQRLELAEPYVSYLEGHSLEEESQAEGMLPTAFINQMDQSNCVPGTWHGEVTVLVVVDLIYDTARQPAPDVGHIEYSLTEDTFLLQPSIVPGEGINAESSVETGSAAIPNLGDLSPTEATQGPTPVPVLTVGDKTVTGNAATQFYFGPGATLTPGGTVVFSGTTVSLAPTAAFIVIGGSTSVIPSHVAGSVISTKVPVLPINGARFTADPGPETVYAIGGQRLTLGGQITVAGLTISLSPDATALVVNGVTTDLLRSTTPHTNAPLLPINGQTVTAVNGLEPTYIIEGHMLTPGGIVTIHGQTISLAPSATALVVNGETTTLFPATGTQSAGDPSRTGPSVDTEGKTDGAAIPSETGGAVPRESNTALICAAFLASSIYLQFGT